MSTNISKQKRDDLLQKIAKIRKYISSAPQDENTGNLLSYLNELEKDVYGKKYGLIFEEHREAIDDILETHTPVLREEQELFIDCGGQMNFLIEGDNLASLKILQKTHKGKIDLIYIDPPYNTGSRDFIYNDTYVNVNDGFKHSKWLSFISKRLAISKNLMSSRGLIFISIDDNEVAQLKLLCDEIFGNDNFRGQIVRGTGTPTGQGNSIISNEIDYILVYAKSAEAIFNGLPFDEESSKIYNLSDKYGRYLNRPLRKTGGEDRRQDRPSMYFPITAPDGTQIYPIAPSGYESRWRCQESTYQQLVKDHRIEWKRDKSGWKVYQKFYLEGRTKQPGNLWTNIEGNKKATITIKDLFGKNIFSFPKPVELIYRIAQISSSSDSIILDYFAGSGTTAQAVMKLNLDDGGARHFILCTNNENNICRDVTYERIRRVIDKEKYAASLKYYKVEYVPISEQLYYEYADELLAHIRELVELENGMNFTGNAEIAIVLTEEELADFIADTINFNKCHKLYMGHDILPDEEQLNLIASHHIEVNIISDYYYRDLQEN
ncbi:DNA methyltransferase [Lachnospiraceae bacterium 62-35]